MESVENEIFRFFLRYVNWLHITNTDELQRGVTLDTITHCMIQYFRILIDLLDLFLFTTLMHNFFIL
jgi:hypothetical protein